MMISAKKVCTKKLPPMEEVKRFYERKIEREKARTMRQEGYSISIIAKILNVGYGSVQLWVKDIKLTPEQQKDIRSRHPKKSTNGWKCNPIPTNCDFCKKTFDYLGGPADFKRSKHFCSKSCYWASKNTTFGRKYQHRMLRSAAFRAKEKQLPFTITLDDIPTIPEECPILHIPLKKGVGKANDNSPSLDRIIPALGYIPGNIRVISKRANSIKTNATSIELMLVAQDLAKLETDISSR